MKWLKQEWNKQTNKQTNKNIPIYKIILEVDVFQNLNRIHLKYLIKSIEKIINSRNMEKKKRNNFSKKKMLILNERKRKWTSWIEGNKRKKTKKKP